MKRDYRALNDRTDENDRLKSNEMIPFFHSETRRKGERYKLAPRYFGTNDYVALGLNILGSTYEDRKGKKCIVVRDGLKEQEAEELAYLARPEQGWMARILKGGFIDGEQLYDVFFIKKMFEAQEKRNTKGDILLAKRDYLAAKNTFEVKAECNMKKAREQMHNCIRLLEGVIEDCKKPIPELYAWLGLSYASLAVHGKVSEQDEMRRQALHCYKWFNYRRNAECLNDYTPDVFEEATSSFLKTKHPIGQ